MDAPSWQRIETLFAEACDRPAAARRAFCETACADDPALLDELWSLLQAHEGDGGVFGRPPLGVAARREATEPSTDVLPEGTRIGVWRVGALINVGGAGEVYSATRADGAFDQRAALKRLYRETAPDHARFLAERQILASLDHPGIARLLDGGVAEDGRLYAVVEYVDGLPLIAHCRARGADLAYRLALFLQVCDVVAYAHRNLVVHRDLKPGNVLVTSEGRVRLLDFGIAKRLDHVDGNDRTTAPFTSDYAAPEQLTGAPITTATDVYALGVVLFELLTEQRPWRSQGMPIARLVQAIVHGEPPAASATAAAHGGPVAPARIAGDLDAIVATCLRKDVANRYPTVDALRRDVERHLADEPVSARGRARSYVFGRALKRYRWPVTAGAFVFASLAIGLAATIWQAHRAAVERDVARQAATREVAVRDQLTNLFRASAAAKGNASAETPVSAKTMLDQSARRVLTEYRDDPQLVGKVVVALADLYGALEDNEGQSVLLEAYLASAAASSDAESVAAAKQMLASNDLVGGRPQEAAKLLADADAYWATAPERYREQRLDAMFVRGQLLRSRGDLDGSIRVFRDAIAERTATSGLVHRETANLYNSLALSLAAANRLDEALAAYRTDLDILTKLGVGDQLPAAIIRANTGTVAYRMGMLREARDVLEESVDRQRTLAGDSAAVAAAMSIDGLSLMALADDDRAVATLRTAAEMASRFGGASSALLLQVRVYLTDALIADRRFDEAQALGTANFDALRERFGDGAVLTQRAAIALANLDLARGDASAARARYGEAAETLRRAGPHGLPWVAAALYGVGDASLAAGRAADAIAPLRESVALRESLLPPTSWELAASRARLGEALMRTGDASGSALAEQGVGVLAAQLGELHPLVVRARRALVRPA